MLIEITFDTRLTYDLTFTWMPHKTCSTKCLDGVVHEEQDQLQLPPRLEIPVTDQGVMGHYTKHTH